MSTLSAETVVTSGNMKMPIVGLGTAEFNENVEAGELALEAALEAGYRHFDTAYIYGTEPIVGKIINNFISSGKCGRDELFIVTKLPTVGNRPELVEMFLKKSLKALHLDYVDLYLIHWPTGFKYSGDCLRPTDSSGTLLMDLETDIIALWKAMEKQVESGRTKAIGLSNFNIEQMQRILKEAKIPPTNLQIEIHVYFQQKEIIKFCKDNNITVCAYAPLGSPGLKARAEKYGKPLRAEIINLNPLADPIVAGIAEKYKKTPGHILLRFLLQLGVAVIPRSVKPERIRQNIDLFDFQLIEQDMEQLRTLDKGDDGRIFITGCLKGFREHPECPF